MITEAMRTQKRWVRIWTADMAISSYISITLERMLKKGVISDISARQ